MCNIEVAHKSPFDSWILDVSSDYQNKANTYFMVFVKLLDLVGFALFTAMLRVEEA